MKQLLLFFVIIISFTFISCALNTDILVDTNDESDNPTQCNISENINISKDTAESSVEEISSKEVISEIEDEQSDIIIEETSKDIDISEQITEEKLGEMDLHTVKDINIIYIFHSGFGMRYPEYKIDIKNKKFWEYNINNMGDYKKRNNLSENEGFLFVKDLENEAIQIFINEATKLEFLLWEETYINMNMFDGHQWGITIIFSDSSEKCIYGSNEYPETWGEMREVFKNLTDENVL